VEKAPLSGVFFIVGSDGTDLSYRFGPRPKNSYQEFS